MKHIGYIFRDNWVEVGRYESQEAAEIEVSRLAAQEGDLRGEPAQWKVVGPSRLEQFVVPTRESRERFELDRLTTGEHAIEMLRILRDLMAWWNKHYASPDSGKRLMAVISSARFAISQAPKAGYKTPRAFYKVDRKGDGWALSLKVSGKRWRMDGTFKKKAAAVATGRLWCRRFSDQRALQKQPDRSSGWKQG